MCGMDIRIITIFLDTVQMEQSPGFVVSSHLDQKLRDKLASHDMKFEKVNNIQIIQPPIRQEFNHCSFAALCKQLDYQLRMLYARAHVPIQLPENLCLFDHEKWQKDLSVKFPWRTRWHPSQLLDEAKTVGAPLWNGKYHIIQEHIGVYLTWVDGMPPKEIVKNLLDFCPIVGIFEVRDDFRVDGDVIYYGTMSPKSDVFIDDYGVKNEIVAHHAVVLLDYLEIDDALYIIYQNSDGDPQKSLCGRGISLMRFELLVELFYGASLPPVHPSAVLQSLDQIGGLQYDTIEISDFLKKTVESKSVVVELRKTMETLLGNGNWKDAYTKLMEIDTVMIQNLEKSYKRMYQFVRKYGDVEKAVLASSSDVVDLIKHSKEFMSFFESVEAFSKEKHQELKRYER